ncbi:MAG TPA: hypothetical protein VJ276_12350 [Thermoanaerobaculia bacterium]|nr:hypothetical protein [Thermoanaerobaculia bacterium]
MSVAEIGALHARYVRMSDRFKSLWTYHQFASGVFKNFLGLPLPYAVDFQKMFERIKTIGGTINAAQAAEAQAALAASEQALDRVFRQVLDADARIPPSMLRRFMEKVKKQDETIIHSLIKFYLYADAVESDSRDKLDFLFTRIGEDFIAERGEYWSRDSLEFREKIIALVGILRVAEPPQDEVVRLIRAIRSMRDEVQKVERFEELTDRSLLRNARTFKHRIGDLYFHPDVLLAVVELNVSTKNRFMKLYQSEESRLLTDADKLMEHGSAIERNFGDTNPELIDEIARFRAAKERFDELRAQSNVKHDVITNLKSSMTNILSQLDRGLGAEEETTADLPEAFFDETEQQEEIAARFGRDDVLLRFLTRIAVALAPFGADVTTEQIGDAPSVKELRLEPWEIDAYRQLFGRAARTEEENEELWMLFLRAAALRVKVDEEATIIATAMAAGVRPEAEILASAKLSLDCAKELDEHFNDFLHEAVYDTHARFVHQLYRSRFRLLRGFSGLWLIYDRQS